MVAILQCHPIRQPVGSLTGSRPATYSAQWVVLLDDQVDFLTMLNLATNVDPAPAVPPAAAVKPIPRKGSYFTWTSPGNRRQRDRSALALDFDGSELLDDGKKWIVNVRWRAPVPGAEEEPNRVNRDPVKRAPYYWVEYYTETEEVFDARPTIPIGTGAILRPAGRAGGGPLTTSAGEEVDVASDERLHMVVVSESNVLSTNTALTINALYFGLLNSNKWPLPRAFTNLPLGHVKGTVIKHQARFLRAETSQYGEWWDGGQYFRMQVRVRLSSKPFYKQVPNRGTWYYNDSTSSVQLFRDTDGVLGKTNLNKDGTIDTGNKPFLVPYQIAGDRTFTRSIGFV